jgi:hypothetical protein
MPGKCPKTGGCCTCGIKKKRKATARRPPPAPVYKGVSVNVLGGTEQQYVNNLMAHLQNLNRPQIAQTVGIAAPVRPVMISTGTDANPLMVSGGIQARVATRTGGMQATAATATTGTGTDAPTTAETGTGTNANESREYGSQTHGTQFLRRPRPATATTGTQVSGADVAALVSLPPSPALSVVGAETRGYGMQTEPQGTGARAVARLFGAIRPSIIAERAANLQNAREVGMAEGYRQGRQRGEAIGAQAAIQNLTFTQTTRTRGTETLTVPELQQRLAAGEVVRAPGGRPSQQALQAAAQAAAGGGGGGGGGGPAAVQAVAEEAAPK